MNIKIISKILCLILLSSALFSCSHKNKDDEKTSAEELYTKAMKLLKNKDYSQAAEDFDKIDDEFPFSKWAVKGQVIAIYARYKDQDFEKVLALCDDFLRLNPASEYVPYVLYMKGLSYYNEIPTIEHAQDHSQQSSFTFRELIARFPNSEYAIDAKEKLSFVDEHLAGTKMSIGRYQIKTKNYVGAIANFSEVVSRYRYTNQVPEAYFRLMEIYYKIGLKDEGNKAANLLQTKYPENSWAKLAEKNAAKK